MTHRNGIPAAIAGLLSRVRRLFPELAKFGVVGATGALVDLGGSAFLYGSLHLGPLTSKAIAVSMAVAVTYLGSRFWTFRHRENQPLARELVLFIVLNAVGLLIAESVIAITAYYFGNKDQLAYNGASVVGTGLGTIFRFFAYRKWVFLAPAADAEVGPGSLARDAPASPGPLEADGHGPGNGSRGAGAGLPGASGRVPR
jgi:putative flippase GtrA